jgi:hypothetical protein
MLRKETVSPDTLELLDGLMKDELLKPFFLAGGTALSLQIGHRISIDIDLFTEKPFDENKLSAYLEQQKGFQLSYIDRNTLKGQINNVQVDLITHAYPLVKDILLSENIRLASLEDIAAMKLNAIVGNGTRLKDFIDIAFLSSYLTLEQMADAYEKKYRSRNPVVILKALAYHHDINFNEPIKYMSESYPWDKIELRLDNMIKHPERLWGDF